jgi:multidrug transporter EmrE-like cation transporter
MHPLLILFVGGVVLTLGDIVAKNWVIKKEKYLYVVCMLFYLIGLNFLVWSYKFEDIAVASIIFEIFNVITLTLAGIYLFKENITKTELAGMILGVFSIIVLEI